MKVRTQMVRWLPLLIPIILLISGCDQATPTADFEILTPTCEVQSLIEAIDDANNDGVPTEIQLPPNCVYPLVVPHNTIQSWYGKVIHNGLPKIDSEIVIRGNNAVIEIAPNSDFGHFFVDVEHKLSLYDLTLSNGARPLGGSVINNQGDFLAYNVKFLNNFAYYGSGDGSGRGGAIYSTNGKVRILGGSIFEGNHAGEEMLNEPNLGGAIFSLNTGLTIYNSFFIENNAAGNGGAIYTERNAGGPELGMLTIQNTEFSRNTAMDGGAIYLLNETAVAMISQSSFMENTASGLGGAIFSQDTLISENLGSFSTNEALHGGALYTRRTAEGEFSGFESDDSVFTGNRATGYGGAIFSENSDLELEDAIAISNQAVSCGAVQLGGTPDLDLPAGDLETAQQIHSESEIYDSILTMNEALTGFGGAVCHVMGDLTIRSTEMHKNEAATYGGALLTMAEMHVSGSQFRQNTASRGGGIAAGIPAYDSNPVDPAFLDFHSSIIESYITDNEAAGKGGGIWTHNGGSLQLISSTISNNTADAEGGGIYQDEGTLTIDNCTLAENIGWRGGGLYKVGPGSVLRLMHTTVAYNEARDTGTELRSKGGGVNINGTVYMRSPLIILNTSNDCDLNQNLDGSYQPCNPGEYCLAVYGADSDDSCGFNNDPVSSPGVGPYNGFYVPILPGSPLIDTHACFLGEDQIGTLRQQGALCEPGSIEYIPSPPPPPPAPPGEGSSSEEVDCDPFAGLDIGVYTLTVDPDTLALPVYLRFPEAVPYLGDGLGMPYFAMLGEVRSYLCNQQGFPDRLYCMFTLQPGDVGTSADLSYYREGCDDPVFTQPMLTIPDIQQQEDTCKRSLGADACAAAGGTYVDTRTDPHCDCP